MAGEPYSRNKPSGGRYSRWGTNPGSVQLEREKVPIEVQRLYDHERGGTVGLETYRKLHKMDTPEKEIMDGIIKGLSMSDYQSVIGQLAESFGLSRSSVSLRFIEESSEKLKAFEERRLDTHRFVALFIDGKYLAREQIVIVLGVTIEGEKIPLGFLQTHTENSGPIKELLNKIIERGLDYEKGLLCVIDGSKGICKAVEETFGEKVVIQRCQWHKRENVLSYLKEEDQLVYKRRLNKAYQSDTYEEAKAQLEQIGEDLEQINLSAARSLAEGLEETLTIHRLGLKGLFGVSFSTTNIIESLNSQIGRYLRNVPDNSGLAEFRTEVSLGCLCVIGDRSTNAEGHQP
ncbi:MAG: transposase [archaeon]